MHRDAYYDTVRRNTTHTEYNTLFARAPPRPAPPRSTPRCARPRPGSPGLYVPRIVRGVNSAGPL